MPRIVTARIPRGRVNSKEPPAATPMEPFRRREVVPIILLLGPYTRFHSDGVVATPPRTWVEHAAVRPAVLGAPRCDSRGTAPTRRQDAIDARPLRAAFSQPEYGARGVFPSSR